MQDFGVVNVEEVGVEDSLDEACNHGNGIKVALGKVAVYPVEDVQGAVDAQGKEIMGGDSLRFTSPLEHEKLREDGDRLKPYREGPENLLVVVSRRVHIAAKIMDKQQTSDGIYL